MNPVRQKRNRSSTSYMVPCIEVTCSSFHSSQLPIHTWCHIWKLHVRPSVYHEFQFIHGAMYGSYMCVLPYFTSSTSYVVPRKAMRCASFRTVFHKFQLIHGAIYGSYMSVLPYFTSSTSYAVPRMAMRCASFRTCLLYTSPSPRD